LHPSVTEFIDIISSEEEALDLPPPDLAPREGDVLVVLVRPENLRRLERLAAAR